MNDLFPAAATDWQREREAVLAAFTDMLRGPTGDGSAKRQRGEKPPWYRDDSHLGEAFRHIAKWLSGERFDKDSNCHHLVHAAWCFLALAWQGTNGTVPPPQHCKD